jgi:ferredoxin
VLVENVTPELRAKVEQAVRDCPRQALSLSKD